MYVLISYIDVYLFVYFFPGVVNTHSSSTNIAVNNSPIVRVDGIFIQRSNETDDNISDTSWEDSERCVNDFGNILKFRSLMSSNLLHNTLHTSLVITNS